MIVKSAMPVERHVLDRQLRIAQDLGKHFTRDKEGDSLDEREVLA